MSGSAAPCRVKHSGDEKRRLSFRTAAPGRSGKDYDPSVLSVGPVHCGSAASMNVSPSLSKPSLHCTVGGGGGCELSPKQSVLLGLSVNALLSVATQPVPSRFRTFTVIGVG